ncbi:MAG: acyltransferase family protein [Clostridia bacterium]|nr:acyltransferase family protein [Clostridia bacterium]
MAAKKIETVDVAKGLGILLVVFAHICLKEPVLTVIYSFHIPLFFILAGMMYNSEKYTSFKALLKSKIKSLGVPYLIFCLIGVLYAVAVTLAECVIHEKTVSDLWTLLYRCLYSIVWAPYSKRYFGFFNVPMWFVPCLLLVFILYYFVRKFIKNKWLLAGVAVLITFVGWLSESSLIPVDFSFLPWNFSSACFAFGFFALGNLAYPFLKEILFSMQLNAKRRIALTVAFFLSAALMIPLALLNGKVSIGSRELGNGLLLYATGILGTAAILFISKAIGKCRFLEFFGRNSFKVMGIHYVIYSVLFGLVTRLDGSKASGTVDKYRVNLLYAGVFFLVVTALTAVFVIIYNRIYQKVSKKNGRTS